MSASLFVRDSSVVPTATLSNGCVDCPTSGMLCPLCSPGYECQLRAGTCNTCAQYICEKALTTGSDAKGSIIGGVVGGICGAALIIGIIFFFMTKSRRTRMGNLPDQEDVLNMDSLNSKSDGDAGVYDNNAEKTESSNSGDLSRNQSASSPNLTMVPGSRSASSADLRRRLLSYELFTRHKTKNNALQTSRIARKQQIIANANSRNTMVDPATFASNRHSVATTVSTTNASNILPIAYIPGVTVRPTQHNTRLLFSNDDSVDDDYLVFSDWNTIENASIVGGTSLVQQATNVRANPRIVQVTRIEEEDEEPTEIPPNGIPFNLESDNDSDIDSDIGEIERATGEDAPSLPDSEGSFMLDVEMYPL